MERDILSTNRKALTINLDQSVYGTIAEIGGGQEVARQFFQAGGASGTVAKSISAYDKLFSDKRDIPIRFFICLFKKNPKITIGFHSMIINDYSTPCS